MLNKILDVKKEEVAKLYQAGYTYDENVQQREIASIPFVQALKSPHRSSAIIAEVKKASPSKGIIREDFDPLHIALQYEAGGADALSVLTDVPFFQGNPSYIAHIKEQVGLPVLRKDFIIDPIQVKQSVQLGADAILLIAKALPKQQLAELYHQAAELGLDSLIEVHDAQELEEVLSVLTPALIGINNRNLSTFETSIQVTKDILPHIPTDVLVISESGINTSEAVADLEQHGVGGFLIGEHFMRQAKIKEAVEALYATS